MIAVLRSDSRVIVVVTAAHLLCMPPPPLLSLSLSPNNNWLVSSAPTISDGNETTQHGKCTTMRVLSSARLSRHTCSLQCSPTLVANQQYYQYVPAILQSLHRHKHMPATNLFPAAAQTVWCDGDGRSAALRGLSFMQSQHTLTWSSVSTTSLS